MKTFEDYAETIKDTSEIYPFNLLHAWRYQQKIVDEKDKRIKDLEDIGPVAFMCGIEEYKDECSKAKTEIKDKDKRIEELEKALEFYASKDNWVALGDSIRRETIENDCENLFFVRCESAYVGGKRARQALKENEL